MDIYVGIDWSEAKHDVVLLNAAGATVAQITIPHTEAGFQTLRNLCTGAAPPPSQCHIGIETKHNLLVDYLWSYGYDQVYVIPPSRVKGCRQRYRSSGARTDASDAYMLADVVRTDQPHLTLWRPDAPLTQQMRALVATLHQLTRQSLALANQLRALLLRYYPGLLVAFPNLQAQTPLAFLARYPTPAAAAAITHPEWEQFLHEQHYGHRQHAATQFAAFQQAPLPTSLVTATVYAEPAQTVAALLRETLQAKLAAQKHLTTLFTQHPDHDIFASLPGTGAFLAPALLVCFGDDRQRFPTQASLQAQAGTCPVTEQSGKHRSVHFRRACDRDFRTYAQQWARASVVRTKSPFACAFYADLRQRRIPDNQAYRCLANRWLAIAWRLWQTHTTYDEAYHLQQRNARRQPLPSKALTVATTA